MSRIPNRHAFPSLRAPAVTFAIVLASTAAMASGGAHKSESEILKELIYHAINLALLLGVLIYFGRKPISEFFETRRRGIQSELDQAAELLSSAEQRNAELQRRLVDLSSEIDVIQERAASRAAEEAERILGDARKTAERIRADAKAAIEQELRRAQAKLREEAADLALEIATRKLREQVGDADRDRLVDEFILRVEPGSGSGSTPGAGSEGMNR